MLLLTKKILKNMEKQKTAVEWLVEQLHLQNSKINEGIIKEALEKERLQIITARVTSPILPFFDEQSYINEAEQYYLETYNQNHANI